MKAKLVALVLAAGLGVTGIAMTAQAAGDCEHEWKNIGDPYEYCVDENVFYHARHHVQDKICTKCRTYGADDEIILEEHTLELQRFANVWECIYCGYTE